ncbi:hypothetical protein RvY_06143-2 [Ramazzottius varieornatus]|uniref:PWWP domain-containing protein n=1 Tax=Ramazzottius varieornatus TaxID=947166 RepID=A0A1D1V6C0_RAMVA|nr:hypothetical protein RvY_06143-2 [Ramazzottius varieornatus]
MATLPSEICVEIESSAEDVMMVSYSSPDGTIYRGVLLKVKKWPSPSVLPVPAPLTETGGAVEASLVPVASVNSVSPATSSPSVVSTGMADYAALQHRWTYFIQDTPPLPRKNIPSRRERERLLQVPKLRPRNFLCARCRYALPGFAQPHTTLATSGSCANAELVPAASSEAVLLHTRKRKVPLKRSPLPPPLMESCSITDGSSTGDSSTSHLDQPPQQQPQQDDGNAAQQNYNRRRKSKAELNQSSAPVATILSADNSLKIKFKLSSLAPSARRVSPASGNARTVQVTSVDRKLSPDDDGDDDDRPRLKIVDDSEIQSELRAKSEEISGESAKVLSLPLPTLEEHSDKPVNIPNPKQKKRLTEKAPRETSSAKPKTPKVAKITRNSKTATSAIQKLQEKQEHGIARGSHTTNGDSLPKPVARAVTRCSTKDNRHFAVGDVVWGKITGYPWWPGIIRHIVICDDPVLQKTAIAPSLSGSRATSSFLQYQEAQVEWYGQKSSISYIEVGQLAHFAEDFERKYKPKLRGAYQEAVTLAKQAVNEHRSNEDSGYEPYSQRILEDDGEREDAGSQFTYEKSRKQYETLGDVTDEKSAQSTEPVLDSMNIANTVYDFD